MCVCGVRSEAGLNRLFFQIFRLEGSSTVIPAIARVYVERLFSSSASLKQDITIGCKKNKHPNIESVITSHHNAIKSV